MNDPRTASRRCALYLLACLAITSVTGRVAASLDVPAVVYLRGYHASFQVPTRIAVDAAGNVYVTDPGAHQVVVRAPSGRIVSRARAIGRPVSIAAAANGRVYVGDAERGAVTAFGSDWQPVVHVGQGAGEFLLPNDLAIDAATGNLYVVDSAAHQVKVYSASGSSLYSFGGRGSGDGQFDFPVGVFVDAVARQVLVVDQLNYRIQLFDPDGSFRSAFGTQGSGPGQFNMPQGLAVDAHGRIYVADSLEGHIQVLDRSGTFVGFIADFGEAAGQLRIPMDVAIDPSNRLFITAANNARLEVFGVDAFTDPESVAPAVLALDSSSIERSSRVAALVAYVEIPAYGLHQIVTQSIQANGVPAATTPIVIADHDGNGTPDARIEFDRAALLATLPVDGGGTIAITGTIAGKQFEAAAAVQITTCGPAAACALGSADPQCNEAVCVPPDGCRIQPRSDGTGCEDGNACTVGDVCGGGLCVGAPLSCNDGNVCTDDSCNPVDGCVSTSTMALCDDADPGTVADQCDVNGVCTGHVLTGNYALLAWPLSLPGHRTVDLSTHVAVRGDVCGERISVGSASQIAGDTVASASRRWGILLRSGSRFSGGVVTGGGGVLGIERVVVDGRVDRSGAADELGACAAARYRANVRWEELSALPPSPDLQLDNIELEPGFDQRIPSTGTLGAGRSVLDAGDIRMGKSSRLTLVGGDGTATVVVHVRGRMMLGPAARIEAVGLEPEQVIFVVDGPVRMRSNASLEGSLLVAGKVRLGRGGRIAGAVLGSGIKLGAHATVDLHPFAGW